MTKQTKKIIISVLVLIGISLFAGIVTLYLIINPTTLLARITKVIHEKTGYQVSTRGQVRLSLYPFLAIHIEELSIMKPAETTPTLTLKEVAMSSPWEFAKMRANNWHFTLRAKELMLHRFKVNHVKTEIT